MNRLQPLKGNGPKVDPGTEDRVVEDQEITGHVRLDGARFRNCRFRKATLVYAGMGGTELSGCSFEETQIAFDGPAANVLALLKAMAKPGSGLSKIIRASFPQVFGH